MLRTGLGISMLIVPLLLNGCGGDTVDPGKQPPPAEQSASQLLSNYTITTGSAGPVQLGMPSAEILAALPGVTAGVELDGEGIEWMTLSMNNETLMNVMLDKNTHTASLIRVLSPRFATAEGVRVGENLQSAGDKLGGLTEIQWTEVESREFATFANVPASMVFQVISNEGTAGVYSNGETITTLASASAAIHSIWLMQD